MYSNISPKLVCKKIVFWHFLTRQHEWTKKQGAKSNLAPCFYCGPFLYHYSAYAPFRMGYPTVVRLNVSQMAGLAIFQGHRPSTCYYENCDCEVH